jgi:hypothetical protein
VVPDEMLYGMIYGFASQFAPRPDRLAVSFPPNGTRRDSGDEFTLVDLRWE